MIYDDKYKKLQDSALQKPKQTSLNNTWRLNSLSSNLSYIFIYVDKLLNIPKVLY